jgi:hypothetical protein
MIFFTEPVMFIRLKWDHKGGYLDPVSFSLNCPPLLFQTARFISLRETIPLDDTKLWRNEERECKEGRKY